MTLREEQIGQHRLILGNCIEVLPTLSGVHACVTDPPYHLTSIVKRFSGKNSKPVRVGDINASNDLKAAYARQAAGFMGQTWDGGDIAFRPETWDLVLNALLPGAHLAAFSGCRTYHRMACAIEDAGFDVREMIAWVTAQGFPKSLDVSKQLDRMAGAKREVVGFRDLKKPNGQKLGQALSDRSAASAGCFGPNSINDYPITAAATEAAKQWSGWGTALKPAFEPICLARSPLSGKTVAQNVLEFSTGALNIDACRIAGEPIGISNHNVSLGSASGGIYGSAGAFTSEGHPSGRWPANFIHDGSEQVVGLFPQTNGGTKRSQSGVRALRENPVYGKPNTTRNAPDSYGDGAGSAARFFYCAKVSPKERGDSKHPTMKPIALMEWLIRLVTPPKGIVLDPFMGSGSTGIAAHRQGFRFIGIEQSEEYFDIARRRIEEAMKQPDIFVEQSKPTATPETLALAL